MDGYYGSGVDVLPIPLGQEPSDRLPSPNSWSRWGILSPGTLEEGSVIMDEGNVSSNGGDPHFELYLEFLAKYQPSNKNIISPFVEDDFFYWNTSLDDSRSGPFCFSSQCDRDAFPPGLGVMNSTGLPEISGKIVELEEQPLLASRYLHIGHSGTPNKKDSQSTQVVSKMPPEEVALEELKMVMELMTDQTRICFRDALYRLADNSKQRADGQEQEFSLSDERSWKGVVNESKTNVIDRAIANIMFNGMDCSVQEDHLESAPADFDIYGTEFYFYNESKSAE